MSNLNNEQLEAIQYPYTGPVLVLAGAGTGKTTVLTKRIEYLITELCYEPNNILAITFTNKAGAEIKKRLNDIGYDLNWVGTFHSICMKILRRDIIRLNRSQDFKIIDPDDINKILKNILTDLNIKPDYIPLKTVLYYIEKLKTSFYSVGYNKEIFDKFVDKFSNRMPELETQKQDIEQIWKLYEEKLLENNYLDFNDLLNYTTYILKEFEEAKRYWNYKFEYILIDEFQDTNDVQYELLMLLKNDDNNLFAVGDGDQTIYSFRGANPNIINNFIELIPDNKIIVLKQNYRSTQNILNASNALIDKNKNRVKKSLISNNGDGNKPILFEAPNDFAEAAWVCKNILDLTKNKGVKLSEIAILLRSNYLTRIFEQELVFQNIKYRIFGGLKFYQRAEIKDLISYLQVVENNDELSLLRILNVPSRKIGSTSEQAIIDYAKFNGISFYQALLEYENLPVTPIAKKSIAEFINLMNDFKNYQYENIADLLDYIMDKIEYKNYYEKKDESRKHIVKENIDELRQAIQIFQASNPEAKLIDYLQNISLFTDKENSEDETNKEDCVSVMTVHNSKGLEFNYVFLVAFNEGVFPSNLSIKDGEVEEERRVAYVALTRARKELFISYNKSQDIITKTPKLPSQFISDIGKDNLNVYRPTLRRVSNHDMEWYDSTRKQKEVIANNFDKTMTNDYKIGDIVAHIIYGAGAVIGIENNILVIKFSNKYGVKKILFNHNSIKRMFN